MNPTDHGPTGIDLDQAALTLQRSLEGIWHDFLVHLPQLAAGAVVLVATGLLTWSSRRVFARLLARTQLRRSLRELFGRLLFIGLWIGGMLVAAMVVFPGLTPTKALGGLGIASVAIGFAFKDIFENFFAGVLILWRFPFDNGDYIECGDLMGRVEEITIRNTLLRRPTGELVVVPNSRLFTEPVEVLTDGSTRRVSIVCGIAYGESIRDAIRVVRRAVQRCDTVAEGSEVEVLAKEFSSSSVDLEVTWWTNPRPGDQRHSRNQVVRAVHESLRTAGIEIPFPHRKLLIEDSLRIERSRELDPRDTVVPAGLPG